MSRKHFHLCLTVVMVISMLVVTQCSTPAATTTQPGAADQPAAQSTQLPIAAGEARDENWLIGTWEGTMPDSVPPLFAGKKVQLVVDSSAVFRENTVGGQPHRLTAFSGSFTWDVDGSAWTQSLSADELKANPGATFNALVWESTANVSSLDHVSLQIKSNAYEVSLAGGPDSMASAPAGLVFYGSVDAEDQTADLSAIQKVALILTKVR